MPLASLTLRFIDRELRNRFAGSFTGGLWALIAPLIQLAVYAFVFVHILNARVPGADAPGYVPFLFAALWPWNALAESLVRSTTVVQENAALIGKIALPREVLVLASVASSFIVNFAGFVAIVVVLALAGKGIDLAGLAPAVALYVALFTLSLGLALAFAAIQVFVRDLAQALGQILMILMFCAFRSACACGSISTRSRSTPTHSASCCCITARSASHASRSRWRLRSLCS